MKQWYEALFENYSHKYENEIYTRGTLGECNFIEQEINYNKDARILDIGCGTGRHSTENAKRGYHNITGIDLSESMLRRAKEITAIEKLNINFLVRDARELSFNDEFDLAIMLCEGGFSLMETDEMNFQILKNADAALRKDGKLIFTTLNGLFPLFHSVKDFMANNTESGNAVCEPLSFDLMTFRDYNKTSFVDDSGNTIELDCNERFYVPSEITWMLKSLHFAEIEIFGAKLGAFSRNDRLTTEDFEMLVAAKK